eukprot:scaffold348841_cov39-Prasinocladus_malaysianus.AAC.1
MKNTPISSRRRVFATVRGIAKVRLLDFLCTRTSITRNEERLKLGQGRQPPASQAGAACRRSGEARVLDPYEYEYSCATGAKYTRTRTSAAPELRPPRSSP